MINVFYEKDAHVTPFSTRQFTEYAIDSIGALSPLSLQVNNQASRRVDLSCMDNVRKIYFVKAEDVPNSTLPVLLYRGALAANAAEKAKLFRERFRANGWTGLWTDTIYDYTHFHSNAHEVLGIAEGRVSLRLGGEAGSLLRLKAGDMLILPAGVGHRRVGDDSGLKVIGAYPRGQSHYDMKRKGRRVPKVALPSTDPFYGGEGPLLGAWHSADGGRSQGKRRRSQPRTR